MTTNFIFPSEWMTWMITLARVLHQRSAWRLAPLVAGIVLAHGRRTITSWLRVAGIGNTYKSFYYFIGALARKSEAMATILFEIIMKYVLAHDHRVLMALDDSPTKRYGPKVQGAGIHHNPTPGPSRAKFLYGHIWVTLSVLVRHRSWGTIGLPLWAKMYVRAKDIATLPATYQVNFQNKLQQGAELVQWASGCCKRLGKTLWVVTDGGYTKQRFIKPVVAAGVTLVTRLRKDAALYDLPPKVKKPGKGRPRIYGYHKIQLLRKARQKSGWFKINATLYGQKTTKWVKMFQATYPPAGGRVLVLISREDNGDWRAFMCTNLQATGQEILEAVADRSAIEQDFHDLKEVEGIGQQQTRNYWASIGTLNLNLWVHTLVELWAWQKPAKTICNRSVSPWDDAERRPSHADRRSALRRSVMEKTFFESYGHNRKSRKIIRLLYDLERLAG
jgi:hypothetical protein